MFWIWFWGFCRVGSLGLGRWLLRKENDININKAKHEQAKYPKNDKTQDVN